MSDIIERLRSTEYDDLDACKAADEIEFLRARVAELYCINGALRVANSDPERLAKSFTDAVMKLAFSMPAPNVFTPQFVQLCINAQTMLSAATQPTEAAA